MCTIHCSSCLGILRETVALLKQSITFQAEDSSLWNLACMNTGLSQLYKFYVHGVFKDDLSATEKRMRQKLLQEPSLKPADPSTAISTSFVHLDKSAQESETFAKDETDNCNESFSMTQLEKTAMLDRLGMEDDDTKKLHSHQKIAADEIGDDIQCSGFCRVSDVIEEQPDQVCFRFVIL